MKSNDAEEHTCHSHFGSSIRLWTVPFVSKPRKSVCQLTMTQYADISDFTYFDQNLPPEMETYIRNKIVRLPRGYFDRWFDELGHYEPIRDEALAWSGLLPGLSIKEWQRDFPGQDFPIIRRIDSGFPARYEEFLLEHRFDVDLLNRLEADEYELDRLPARLCPRSTSLP